MTLTFDIRVSSAVIAHAQSGTFLGLGAQRRLEQVVHTLVVDFEKGHP